MNPTRELFIENNCGLCNRLEIYVLAYAIHRSFGHSITMDWPEMDSLLFKAARHGRPGLFERLGAARVRRCDADQFRALATRRRIILRGFSGPEEWMSVVYEDALSQVAFASHIVDHVESLFRQANGHPVVGVHLRQGDYRMLSEDVYDLRKAPLSAVPIWWHEWMMQAIVNKQPDTRFLLCHNGDGKIAARLKMNFDVLETSLPNPYLQPEGHKSSTHPVADLAALACCPVILATPVSSFSHFAGNVFGKRALCITPPQQMTKATPAAVCIHTRGPLLDHWANACMHGANTPANLEKIDFSQPAQLGWLRGGQPKP